jgi:rhodanese-related sulfurtransferase
MSIFGLLFGTRGKSHENIKKLNANDFKSQITNKNVQLVDVRTAKEYKSGHIEHAINIDYFQQGNFKTAFEKLDKTKPLYLYCRSGNRSSKAAKLLASMGFNEIYDLQGGIIMWD